MEENSLDAETEAETPESPIKSFARTLLSVVEFLGTVTILVVLILGFGLQSFHVVGMSMSPTLQEGDRLLISKLGRTWSRVSRESYIPERGDIIVFDSPTDNLQLVKRVVGLPGDRVTLQNGSFTIYNDQNPEGFNPDNVYDSEHNFEYTSGSVNTTVPDEEIFVVGDNRSPGGSLDSRNSLGTLPVEYVVGKLVLRVLPITEARSF